METLIQRKRKALKTLTALMNEHQRPHSTREGKIKKCMSHLDHLDRRIRELS